MDVGHCFLDGNADAVEFCPDDAFHSVLAASTYTLQEGDKPSRAGSISLFEVDSEMGRLELIHRMNTAGVFDIKWSPVSGNVGRPLLAQADADGCVKIHRLESSTDDSGSHGNYLKEVCGEHVSSSMCLCVDWNPSSTCITTGLSDGSVSVVSLAECQLTVARDWKAHEFELWAAAFDIHQQHLLYTGSDDCRFSGWDLRDDSHHTAFQNTRAHKMGVCCIAKSPSDPNTLLTGSYDESLRIWDIRSISTPVVESSTPLGGGVWRVKHHPSIPGLFLTACMHNGFAIVNFHGGKAEVVKTYNKHGSLAYGADWQRGAEGLNKRATVATCSFYDRLLRLWVPEGNLIM